MVDNEITYLTVKLIITLVLSAIIIPTLKEVYQKLRNGKNSDVLGDAIAIFASPFIIYVVLAMINIGILFSIDEDNNNWVLDILILIGLISIVLFTIFMPFSYARNYILIKNKFYLFRRDFRIFELLKKGVDLTSEHRFKIERNVANIEEINTSTSGEYKVEYQKYYDNKEDIYFTEAIYINEKSFKRFRILVPKKLIILCILSFLIYILQIILLFCFGSSVLQTWILVIWIILIYWVNFMISIRITGIIEKDNEKEKYVQYYRENNLI
ncbi:hypothetical protein [Staphylococcus xylosus]